jgi:hypothetical protein
MTALFVSLFLTAIYAFMYFVITDMIKINYANEGKMEPQKYKFCVVVGTMFILFFSHAQAYVDTGIEKFKVTSVDGTNVIKRDGEIITVNRDTDSVMLYRVYSHGFLPKIYVFEGQE